MSRILRNSEYYLQALSTFYFEPMEWIVRHKNVKILKSRDPVENSKIDEIYNCLQEVSQDYRTLVSTAFTGYDDINDIKSSGLVLFERKRPAIPLLKGDQEQGLWNFCLRRLMVKFWDLAWQISSIDR